jgi:hypothetical protein
MVLVSRSHTIWPVTLRVVRLASLTSAFGTAAEVEAFSGFGRETGGAACWADDPSFDRWQAKMNVENKVATNIDFEIMMAPFFQIPEQSSLKLHTCPTIER